MAEQLIYAVTLASIFLIAGLGLYVLSGLCGQVSIAQATYVGVGTCLCSYFTRSSHIDNAVFSGRGMPFLVGLVLTMLITGIVAAVFGLCTIRLKGAGAISASIAASVLVLYIMERLQFISGGSRGASSAQTIGIGNTNFTDLVVGKHRYSENVGIMVIGIILALASIVYIANITRSPLARAMRTVRERHAAAQTCEVSPLRAIVAAHFIAGVTAGIAGSVYAHLLGSFEMTSSNPWLGTFGIIASMQLLAFVVLGGMKSLWVSIAAIVTVVILSGVLSESAHNISFFDTARGGHISPSQATALVSSAIVLGIIHISARYRRSRQ